MGVICFFGGSSGPRSISGGDRHALEVWSRWATYPGCDLVVYAPLQGAAAVGSFHYPLSVIATEAEASNVGALRLGYFKRAWGALLKTRKTQVSRGDVIYAASSYFYDVLPAVVLKLKNKGAILVSTCFHLVPPPNRRSGNALTNAAAYCEQRLMLRLLARFADRIIVDNAELEKDLALLGFSSGSTFVTSMGSKFEAVKDGTVGGDSASSIALYVGRFSEQKGVERLLRAFKAVSRSVPGAQLKLVGNNEAGFSIKDLVSRIGVDRNVVVLSGLSDEEVHREYLSARFFVTASLEEGYGISVLEALSCGLPCVTYEIDAFRLAFPVGRFQARNHSVAALKDAMLRMYMDEAAFDGLKRSIATEFRSKPWAVVADELWEWVSRAGGAKRRWSPVREAEGW